MTSLLSAVGTTYSVIAPLVVIRPILLRPSPDSVNHRAPSGPAVDPFGRLFVATDEHDLLAFREEK